MTPGDLESKNLTALLVRCQEIVNRICRQSGRPPSQEVTELQKTVHEAQGAAHGNKLSEQQMLLTWQVALDIWNYHTEQSAVCEPAYQNVTAQVLQCACTLVELVPNTELAEQDLASKAQILYKTGSQWCQLKEYENAEACFSKSMPCAASWKTSLDQASCPGSGPEEAAEDLFGLFTLRMTAAWQLDLQTLAEEMLKQAQDLINHDYASSRVSFHQGFRLVTMMAEQARMLTKAKQSNAATNLLKSAMAQLGQLALDEDDPSLAEGTEITWHLRVKVLRMLAHSLLETPGNAAAALNMIHQIRQETNGRQEDAAKHGVNVLAIQALIELDRADDAAAELLQLASSRAPIAMLLDALKSLLTDSSSFSSALQESLQLILHRQQDDANVTSLVIRMLLQKEDHTELEDYALQIAQTMTDDIQQDTPQQRQIFGLLWNKATVLFQHHNFERACELYAGALTFAQGALKAKTARTLAMCCLGMADFDRTKQYLQIADTSEPGSAITTFMRLKVNLEQGNSEAAAEQIQKLSSDEEATTDVLLIACHEAIDTGCLATAKTALEQLLEQSCSNGASEKPNSSGGLPGIIFQNLIKITSQLAEKDRQDEMSLLTDLTRLYKDATQRLSASGPDAFLGEPSRAAVLEWFAAGSWNTALRASQAKHTGLSAELFASSGAFYSRLEVSQESLKYQEMCFLMSGASYLSPSPEAAQQAGTIATARSMLARCREANGRLNALLRGNMPADAGKMQLYLELQELQIGIAQKDVSLEIVDRCIKNDYCGPMLLAWISDLLSSGSSKGGNSALTKTVLNCALNKWLESENVSPDEVAKILRRLMELSQKDQEKLEVLHQASNTIKRLPRGMTYPARELQWLTVSGWNRGSIHCKFERLQDASAFMSAALDLGRHCATLEDQRKLMEETLMTVQAQSATSCNVDGS
ncbi:hypothetical protein WJX74_001098 [Apatococcus lobatus]|uniref:Protein ZIP4 homolog n=1 Tax=Apatococcus lobatus TaxID=904363 RepID=A0AAW1RII3_9CHLO